ncbi:cell wall-binding repeat-containing protein [Euzebya sp.]|uniref:cell wall-binding repeat-containing protein n=1 Tax=Euzebya sp. TaxID=1971409 RepID=UPI003514693F
MTTRRPTPLHLAAGVVLAVLLAALLPSPSAAQPEVNADGDTLFVVKADETPSNAEIAARLSTETFGEPAARVVIGRDDEFADALASGLLQRDAPLLLVPTDGPIPPVVADELDRLAPEEAVVLGGEAAVGPAVVAELADRDIDVTRYAGASRLETAVAVAEAESPAADTVILARAFGAEGSTDPTQAYADVIAAGGLAAANGWPVLLTATDSLPATTRAHLEAHADDIDTVVVLGGTAAVSDAVLAEAVAIVGDGERVAGPSRAATAVAVAAKRGAPTAADAASVILVDGNDVVDFTQDRFTQGGVLAGPDAWAAGFAAAALSGRTGAPILLSAGATLPPETRDHLAGGLTGRDGVALVCLTSTRACESARIAGGLAPPPPVEGRIVFEGSGGIAGDADIYELAADGAVDVVASDAHSAVAAPDGSAFAYTQLDRFDGNHQLAVATLTPGQPAGADVRVVADGLLNQGGHDWAADGSAIATRLQGGALVTVDTDGASAPVPLDLSPYENGFDDLDWLDGIQILSATTGEEVVLARRDGSAAPQVLVPPAPPLTLISGPLVSPDRTRVALSYADFEGQGRGGIRILDLPTGQTTTVPGTGDGLFYPDEWSPDGTQLLVDVQGGLGYSVALATVRASATADSAPRLVIGGDESQGWSGTFSPDGTTLAVQGRFDGTYGDGTPIAEPGLHLIDVSTRTGRLLVSQEDVRLFTAGDVLWLPR